MHIFYNVTFTSIQNDLIIKQNNKKLKQLKLKASNELGELSFLKKEIIIKGRR